jgi:uncharacterized membrane protein YhdT
MKPIEIICLTLSLLFITIITVKVIATEIYLDYNSKKYFKRNKK